MGGEEAGGRHIGTEAELVANAHARADAEVRQARELAETHRTGVDERRQPPTISEFVPNLADKVAKAAPGESGRVGADPTKLMNVAE